MAADAAPRSAPEASPLEGRRIGVVASERDAASARLADAACAWLEKRGARVDRHGVPAAFEVAQFTAWLAAEGEVDGVVACASIVRGETSHDRHLAAAVTASLLEVAVRTGVPVGNAVLTVDTPEQAEARSGGAKGNRGEDAARAVAGLLRARASQTRGRPVDLGPVDGSAPGSA